MFANMRIGLRMTTGFVIILAIFAITTIFSWNTLRQIETDTGHLAGERFQEIRITADIEKAILKATGLYGEYAFSGNETFMEEGAKSLEEADRLLEKAMVLAGSREDMAELTQGGEAATEAVAIFRKVTGFTRSALFAITESRRQAAEALLNYRRNVDTYLEGEKSELESEVEFEMGSGTIMARVEKIATGNHLIESILKMDREVYRGQALRDSTIIEEAMYELAGVRSDVAKLRSQTYVAASRNKLGQVTTALLSYETAMKDLVANWEELDQLLTELEDASRATMTAASTINAEGFRKVDGLADKIVANLGRTVKVSLGVTFAAILMGLAVSLVMTRSILKPLRAVVTMARRGGEGDLTLRRADFRLDSRDEVGEMAEELEKMLTSQREVVEAIKREASQTMKGSRGLAEISDSSNRSMEEIRRAVKELSLLSETNAASLEEANASIEEVSSGARSSAESSGEAAQLSNETRRVGEEASLSVEKIINEVRETAGETEANAGTVQRLVSSVQKIAGFVTTIGGIADQTNLLALNAAIEAARAGDHGRGFAVVADEVRKLAENSNLAAREIDGLIETLRAEAEESAATIYASVKNMQGTAERAEGAKQSLALALERTRQIDGVVQNLASIAQEQAAVSHEMAGAVEQVTQANNTVVEKIVGIGRSSESTVSASARVAEEARELAEGAARMKALLERFVIEKAETATGAEEIRGEAEEKNQEQELLMQRSNP